MDIRIDYEGIPVSVEYDSHSGEFTASNDDLQVMAIADSEAEARKAFREALSSMVLRELSLGHPLPHSLTHHVRELVLA